MEQYSDPSSQSFLNNVADAMDAAADRMELAVVGSTESAGTRANWAANFPQKLVYSSCYSLSFGVCFPVFLAARYVPKDNAFVKGIIAGSSAASADVDAWLARAAAKQAATAEETELSDQGAAALAPA